MKILYNSEILSEQTYYNELKKSVEIITYGPDENADIAVPRDTTVQNVLSLMAPQVPDLIVIVAPEHNLFPPDIMNAPCPTLVMLADWNWYYHISMAMAQSFDMVFSDKNLINILSAKGMSNVYPWDIAYLLDSIHKTELEKIYDITFIGSIKRAHPKRDKLLEKILFTLNDKYKVNIKEGVYEQDYINALNQSKIIFNYSARGDISSRILEGMGCGRMVLTESDNICVKEAFNDREHLVLYHEDNLTDLISYYIENEDERERIALAGYNEVREKHKPQDRANQFLKKLKEIEWDKQYGKRLLHSPTKKYYDQCMIHYIGKGFSGNINSDALPWQTIVSTLIKGMYENDINNKSALLNEALLSLAVYIELNPDSQISYYYLGIVCLLIGETDHALIILRKMAEELTASSGIDEEIIIFEVTEKTLNLINLDFNMDLYNNSEDRSAYIKKQYLLIAVLKLLAFTYSQTKKYDEALIVYKKILNLLPGSQIYYKIADIYEKMNNIDEAIYYYLKCYNSGEPFNIDVRTKLIKLMQDKDTEYLKKEIELLNSVRVSRNLSFD